MLPVTLPLFPLPLAGSCSSLPLTCPDGRVRGKEKSTVASEATEAKSGAGERGAATKPCERSQSSRPHESRCLCQRQQWPVLLTSPCPRPETALRRRLATEDSACRGGHRCRQRRATATAVTAGWGPWLRPLRAHHGLSVPYGPVGRVLCECFRCACVYVVSVKRGECLMCRRSRGVSRLPGSRTREM